MPMTDILVVTDAAAVPLHDGPEVVKEIWLQPADGTVRMTENGQAPAGDEGFQLFASTGYTFNDPQTIRFGRLIAETGTVNVRRTRR